ncbi:glycosyltransferase family 4 protein [Massilia sp. YIM B02763]|uniref:glycosyltransferase family 4 protein n=1 Tax=Massilia sp. YIM B02763 TaxID=3050130 RepID=UPI0025B6FE7E|nr:glycosyltransferase family 4 protein [Massilia sp. YIM B02763]MDN4053753.1 glycosyltransferase family 4 protein [Massilia sp. YIM B02763]
MPTQPDLPGVLFTMRYPDDTGYVWNYIAGVRDRASSHLKDRAATYMAFPRLTGNPSYQPGHMTPVELDCYDNSAAGRAAIEAFVRAHDIKVMVFMSALPQTVCLDLLRRLGVRTINTEDDSYDPSRRDGLAKRGMKFLLRRVLGRQQHDLHLANSAAQQQFLLDYQLLPPGRVVLMKNSVDCARFCPGDQAAARAATGLDPDRFWLLAVAQARPEKRIDQLIRVVHAVAQARPQARIGFVYVGDGPPVAAWKQLAEELGVADRCVFAGRRNDVLPYYRAADLMVHAAERESFGLAIVEAMACGIPVVASAAAGPRETIVDGQTGALVDLHDFEAFTQAVLRYVDDDSMTKMHGNNARAHVDRAYNVVRHGKEFAQHIARFI